MKDVEKVTRGSSIRASNGLSGPLHLVKGRDSIKGKETHMFARRSSCRTEREIY